MEYISAQPVETNYLAQIQNLIPVQDGQVSGQQVQKKVSIKMLITVLE
jgi:hypothetical protein